MTPADRDGVLKLARAIEADIAGMDRSAFVEYIEAGDVARLVAAVALFVPPGDAAMPEGWSIGDAPLGLGLTLRRTIGNAHTAVRFDDMADVRALGLALIAHADAAPAAGSKP